MLLLGGQEKYTIYKVEVLQDEYKGGIEYKCHVLPACGVGIIAYVATNAKAYAHLAT